MRLGRFLKKNTPKAGSRKRKGSPHTVNKKVAIFFSCIRRNELLVRLLDLIDIENDLTMVKKYENPILVGSANSNKPSGRKRNSLKGEV